MKSCPRCESSIDDAARFCSECGTPQTEDATEEFDERVRQRAEETGATGGNARGDGGTAGNADDARSAGTAALTDRERLWRRGAYVVGYATAVVALTRIASPGAWFLLAAGVAILPPTRRLLGRPLGGTFKREVMAGLYVVLVAIGAALFVLL